MKRIFFFGIIGVFLISCLTEQPAFVITPPAVEEEIVQRPIAFVITDYKNRNMGAGIPVWASYLFEDGSGDVRSDFRSMEATLDSFIFIARSDGNNFSALKLWQDGFNAELDFPRLAAARVEARFSAGVHFPGEEYGTLYETLIRTISDIHWTEIVKEDDFWVRRLFAAEEEEPEREDWEFLILVTIEKTHFTSRLNSIFQSLRPRPSPTERQRLAFNRVVEQFFDGF